jgi:hypothetical protein
MLYPNRAFVCMRRDRHDRGCLGARPSHEPRQRQLAVQHPEIACDDCVDDALRDHDEKRWIDVAMILVVVGLWLSIFFALSPLLRFTAVFAAEP